jgi:hypothetical protein
MPVIAKPYPTRDQLSAEFISWFKSKLQPNGDCLEWQGPCVGRGYGAVSHRELDRQLIASRVAYIIAHGTIDQKLHVLHTCDNQPCCNPDHLYAGTHAENMKDASDRMRFKLRIGPANHNAKLTNEQVASARALHASGISGNVLSKKFGIAQTTMARILRGKAYRIASDST